jgi:hypothetical protein
MSSLSNLFAAAEEPPHQLPMAPLAFGVLAFVGFLLLLGVLWFFRGTAAKIAAGNPHVHGHDAHDARSDHQGGHH